MAELLEDGVTLGLWLPEKEGLNDTELLKEGVTELVADGQSPVVRLQVAPEFRP